MIEFIAIAAIAATVYGLAAFGKARPKQPVIIPAPERKLRRRGR
jgi:hypothetical protein